MRLSWPLVKSDFTRFYKGVGLSESIRGGGGRGVKASVMCLCVCVGVCELTFLTLDGNSQILTSFG